MRDLCESPDPAAAVAGAQADRIGDLAAILANTAEDKRDPNKPHGCSRRSTCRP